MDSNGLRFWMLSRAEDWFASWRANTVYVKGQGVVDPDGHIQIAQSSGKSDAKEPNWKTNIGGVTSDASVSWLNVGPGSWQASTAFLEDQYIVDPNGNLQRVLVEGVSGSTEPVWPQALNQTCSDNEITWSCAGPSQAGLFYCNSNQRLQLRSMRSGNPPVEDFDAATGLVEAVPMALDQYGTYARWDASSGRVVAGGAGAGDSTTLDEVPIYAPPQPDVTDLALGYDGILYVAVGGALVMVDRRDRWPNFTLTVPDFNFWRLAALPGGGVLALDRDKPQLAKVSGQPLPVGPIDTPNPGVLRPCEVNPNPPQLVARFDLPPERFVAIAPMDPTADPQQFVLLSWFSNTADNQTANIRFFSEGSPLGSAVQLTGVCLPYGVAGLGNQKLAVLATNIKEALIYDLSNAGDALVPAGETYILSAQNLGPLVHGFSLPPNYANAPGAVPPMFPLLPLSLNSFASSGGIAPFSPAIIDSGGSQTVWHRTFVEAIVPPRCGAIIWLTASDALADLTNPSFPWYPHTLGSANIAAIPSSMQNSTASAVWQSIDSEVAFAPSLLKEDAIPGRQGLFMALVQRANKAVRNLAGRYLGVRIQLNGEGRNTPEIAGLRVYASRFSYVQRYLPEVYHEGKFGLAADQEGDSSRRDFLERFVNLFEAQFTRMEDRIANAYLLTRPESSPDDSLDWLGGWIGVSPNSYPPDRRRARLEAIPDLYRKRGTGAGVAKALDVATNGMCSRGAIIVIEDFRLRHLFATILGADLSIKNDPLLPGYSASSNSIVGNALFLGDPGVQAELQALFEKDLQIPGGAQAAQAFYEQLAHRMTVFVHNQVENVNLNLVKRIVEAEKPAHVQAVVRIATQPFMIGLASLLGINTYLGPQPPRNPARVDVSEVGRYDVITHLPSLDPRMESAGASPGNDAPVARIKAPNVARVGHSIMLDGSASSGSKGTDVSSFEWRLVPQ